MSIAACGARSARPLGDHAKGVARNQYRPDRALEHVPDTAPGQDQPPRWNQKHAQDGEAAVQQGHPDRAAHPDRVDRARVLEQEAAPRWQVVAPEQSTDTFPSTRGDLREEALAAGLHDEP